MVGRPVVRGGGGVVGQAAYNHNLAIGGKLQDVEDKMRARLKQARSLHAGEKAILLGAFHGRLRVPLASFMYTCPPNSQAAELRCVYTRYLRRTCFTRRSPKTLVVRSPKKDVLVGW